MLSGGGGGSLVITMKGGHDPMKNRCGFYSKIRYYEGVVEGLRWGVGELGRGNICSNISTTIHK